MTDNTCPWRRARASNYGGTEFRNKALIPTEVARAFAEHQVRLNLQKRKEEEILKQIQNSKNLRQLNVPLTLSTPLDKQSNAAPDFPTVQYHRRNAHEHRC